MYLFSFIFFSGMRGFISRYCCMCFLGGRRSCVEESMVLTIRCLSRPRIRTVESRQWREGGVFMSKDMWV